MVRPAIWIVGRSGRGSGVGERNREDHSGGFALKNTCRLENGCRRLACPCGVHREDVFARMGNWMNRNVADAAEHSCHVGRHSRRRAGNGAVALVGLNQAADILVEREVEGRVPSHVALIPAGRRQRTFGRAVGEHEDYVFGGADLIRGRACRGHRQNYCCRKKETFEHIRKDTKRELNV